MKIKFALLLLLAGSAATNALACYTVYDRSNAIVYYAQTPPFDMTPPFNDRLQNRFPGSHLVFDNKTDCPARQAGYNPNRAPASTAPLFTDKQTAEEMKLAHTVLPNGTAMVAKPPSGMRPGFTVMNLDGKRTKAASSGTVITEMRKPARDHCSA